MRWSGRGRRASAHRPASGSCSRRAGARQRPRPAPATESEPVGVADRRDRLGELARLFLWLGIVGFGGPAAHLALMEEQVVRRRGWLAPAEFVDLVGLTN